MWKTCKQKNYAHLFSTLHSRAVGEVSCEITLLFTVVKWISNPLRQISPTCCFPPSFTFHRNEAHWHHCHGCWVRDGGLLGINDVVCWYSAWLIWKMMMVEVRVLSWLRYRNFVLIGTYRKYDIIQLNQNMHTNLTSALHRMLRRCCGIRSFQWGYVDISCFGVV